MFSARLMSRGISRNHGPVHHCRARVDRVRAITNIRATCKQALLRDATMTTPTLELVPEELLPVPVVDLSGGGLVRRAAEASARARGLRDACVNSLPRPPAALLPALDSATPPSLRRSSSPC